MDDRTNLMRLFLFLCALGMISLVMSPLLGDKRSSDFIHQLRNIYWVHGANISSWWADTNPTIPITASIFSVDYGNITSLPKNLYHTTVNGDTTLLYSSSTTKNYLDINVEEHNVAFVKVHKAGSSTVQNVLLRYGFYRNLTFVLPRIRMNQWSNVISITDTVSPDNIVPPPPDRTYNILCHHVIYNETAFRKIMPPSTKVLGILRNPLSHFKSSLNYFRPYYIFNIKHPHDKLLEYFKNPTRYEPKEVEYSFTNNRMAFEFGFPDRFFRTKSNRKIPETRAISLYIEYLKKQFDLVLIMEYFEESMILLKRLLNWQMKDILYIENNKYAYKKAFERLTKYHALYKRWAVLDHALYDAFVRILIDKVRQGGKEFQEELLQFRRNLRKVNTFCNAGRYSSKSEKLVIEQSAWNEQFYITYANCTLLKINELSFTENVRKQQYPHEKLSPELQANYDHLMNMAFSAGNEL